MIYKERPAPPADRVAFVAALQNTKRRPGVQHFEVRGLKGG